MLYNIEDANWKMNFLDSFDKLSLGDARAYFLSTAKNELGVISAQSASGKWIFLSVPY